MKVVLFTKTGSVRIFKNPENLDELRAQGEIVINPVLDEVRGVKIEDWRLVNGEVKKASSVAAKPVSAGIAQNQVKACAIEQKRSWLTLRIKWFILGVIIAFIIKEII